MYACGMVLNMSVPCSSMCLINVYYKLVLLVVKYYYYYILVKKIYI